MSRDDPYQVVAGLDRAIAFLTCEHASQRMPEPWSWSDRDKRLRDTHWAYDLGAREITTELARALEAPAVLARFSRLLIDANRPEDSDTLFLPAAEDDVIELNIDLDPADSKRRLDAYYRPYHQAVDRELARSHAEIVLAVHTFTPVYNGHERTMEIGVLFDREQALADELSRVLADAGMRVAMNQPYSGKDGLIHSAEVHADGHDRRALEIEVRQDRATDPAFRARLVHVLADFLSG
ncbi:MAG: N-formylglutamate amidohydrolase [Proteobacteria bacterium]|nr:N-formylglutamate amidohydrolase [Pseudomonadota bacterium]